MPLNEFGKIAAAEIALYAPILCITLYVTIKNGIRRRQGWLYLFFFAQVRLIGAAITLASQLQTQPSTGLLVAATILLGIGLSPLLMATLGFVSTIAHYGNKTNYTRLLRLLHLSLTAGLILGIIGGTKSTPDNDADTISQGRTFSKAASALFMGSFVALFGAHVLLWSEIQTIPKNHRKLLTGVSLALPFLFVRVIYSLLSAFSSSSQNRWSPINGIWWIYFMMGVVMEYLVVSTYVVTGALTSLDDDKEIHTRGIPVVIPQRSSDDSLMEMGDRKWQERRA